ncbi:diguanylate phosphodiesterase [Erwinia sp. JUb26]|uniref:diguanylate phosphodiesterase n=1 Tax=Erwinia sp. JUb26 TaxID=2485126 RepID=UPI000F49E7F5|nr:diguanylate phosphodiesterase [Erwinia sp. JUb26]ROR15336.1 EAL domain-containing protein (putative c-di-GMP-specific phosphodiesterase class I) [Erwinia sp. JUb26]
MLTTLIYRSHISENFPTDALKDMVFAANSKNGQADVTGILLFNGIHFFQLLEGPEESVFSIYRHICADPRHYNVVEIFCDFAPKRRFGNAGMELFDLREHEKEAVLQSVLDRGTTRYQLLYDDRALQFFRTFVEATEKENYFEIPPAESWAFVSDGNGVEMDNAAADITRECSFAFQPIVDPLAQKTVSLEALIRTPAGESALAFFNGRTGDEVYEADLSSKSVALAMAAALNVAGQTLSINLLPMTLVRIPDAVDFLLAEIKANGLIPEQIIVEFTENEVISRLEEFTNAVRQLKAAGIRVAIDHFGGGFAGLSLLAQFQPERIKINRELIRDVHKSGSRQAIVRAIIQCCASLEIRISAVGVEKPEEWMWLESAGVSHFQGHLFAAPAFQGIPAVCWPEMLSDI